MNKTSFIKKIFYPPMLAMPIFLYNTMQFNSNNKQKLKLTYDIIGIAVGGATVASSAYALLSFLKNLSKYKNQRSSYFNLKVTAAGAALGLILCWNEEI
jgi:hypothetical protein